LINGNGALRNIAYSRDRIPRKDFTTNCKKLEDRVEAKFGTATSILSDRPISTKAEAEQIATAQMEQTMLGLIVGEGVCWGNPKISPGQVIRLEGLSRNFNGNYYVTGVSHRHSFEAGYTTHFKVRRNHYDVD
jgi:phage protein D